MPDTLLVPRRRAPVEATVEVPGSKSIANRALVCAALADGHTTLTNVPDGDDTTAMLACLRALGLDARIDGARVEIQGSGVSWGARDRRLFAGLAGTTSRFVTAMAALGSGTVVIDGHAPLRTRPFGPLHDALRQIGVAVVSTDGEPGTLPAAVTGPPTSGVVRIRGDVSSQYVTGLMLIGPYLPGGLELALTTPLVSRPYVEMTAATMGWFGVGDVGLTEQGVTVGPSTYRPATVAIEPDASSASYPLALGAVLGGLVTVPGLGVDALQGDARFPGLLAEMGATVEWGPDRVSVGGGTLRGLDVDMADVSDLVPTMAVVALFASSPTRIRGVGFIRGKESDRLGDLARELRAAGADIDEVDDGLDVRPSAHRLHGARLATHHDHRLAMAFGVLGAAVDGIVVESPDVVTKSWPGYWGVLDDAFGAGT